MNKKILILAPRLYSYGGVPRVIKELDRIFEGVEGLDMEVVTSRKDDNWSENMSLDIEEISPYPHPYLAFYRPKVRKKAKRADLVWVHHQSMIRPLWSIDTPIIMTYHTLGKVFTGFVNPLTSIRFRIESFLAEKFMRDVQFADRVVAISNYSKDQLSEVFKAKPVRIYHGGDFEESELSEEDEGYIFCPDEIDKTVLRLASKYDIKAVGTGSNSNIEYLGTLSDEDLVEHYKKCSFVLTASGREGFGLSPVEAAFYGKPVVVRSVGGHKEIINHGETGFLAENSKEFLKYVDLLWKDEEMRKEMGRNAFERVNNKFTWIRAAEEYLEEFNDLIGSNFTLK